MRFAADTRGATVLEFALIVAPFIALAMAALQTSLVYFTQSALDTAAEASARDVITGVTQSNDSAGTQAGMTSAQLQERFRRRACASLLPHLTCDNLYVEVRSAPNWDSIDTSMPAITYGADGKPSNSFAYNMGDPGSVVLIRMFYLWSIAGSPIDLKLVNAPNSQRMIVSTSVAKVESYS